MANDDEYRNNHYVPQWYQRRFLAPFGRTNFRVLDLQPEKFRDSRGKTQTANQFHSLGTRKAFRQFDLYTTRFGAEISTEIEQEFFGALDQRSPRILDFWETFEHPNWDGETFQATLPLISVQKLRTPKGLAALSEFSPAQGNDALFAMQKLQNLHCAHWTEAVWSIVDAPRSTPGFILSDHPVTIYNPKCFPGSQHCSDFRDPPIWLNGSQTIFPLSPYRAILFANLSWVRNPYGNPLQLRPNPRPIRDAMFNFQHVQTGRLLTEHDLLAVNYIIKQRAQRYIACAEPDWLFPERRLASTHWSKYGQEWLLMPDPRSVSFSGEVLIGWNDGSATGFDAYGRRPWQSGYDDKQRSEREWDTFHRFQGEYAAKFGPKRRGRSFECGRLDNEEDDPDYHEYHLKFARHAKPKRRV